MKLGYVLYSQEGSVISSGRLCRPCDDRIEAIAQLGKLREQRFDQRYVVLVGRLCIRDVWALILHNEVEIISHTDGKNPIQLVRLAPNCQVDIFPRRGQV